MAQRGIFQGYALLVILSVVWGLAFVAIRRADFELSPINLTLLRWFTASAGFLVLAPFVGRPKTPYQRKDIPRFLLVMLMNVGVYHLSLNYAEKTVSSSLAGVLISLGPVFAVLLSILSLGERIQRRLAVALLLALVGAVTLTSGVTLGFSTLAGPLAVVLSALAYGVFAVSSKPLVSKYGSAPTAILASIGGTAMLIPLLSPGFFLEVSRLSPEGWFSVGYLAVLSTVFGNLLFYTLVSRKAVSTLSVQLYLVPVVSAIGGILLLGEMVTPYLILGGGVILLSVALATGAKASH